MRCATSSCPTGDLVIQDEFATGAENYKEFFYALVGLAGEGQNFDGNGMYVRFQTGGGSQTVSLGRAGTSTGELFGNNVRCRSATGRPTRASGRRTSRTRPATQQKLPNLNGPAAAKAAPTGAAAATAQVKSARDKLRREADLSAVSGAVKPGDVRRGACRQIAYEPSVRAAAQRAVMASAAR